MYDGLDCMLSLVVIEDSNSSWSSLGTLVRKDIKNRLRLGACKMNDRIIKDGDLLPHTEGLLSRLQDTRYISAIELKDALWQIPLEKSSREKTTFIVLRRPFYQITITPFNISNAGQRICRLMDKVIPGYLRGNVFIYLIDLLDSSPSIDKYLLQSALVADCLKCEFTHEF